MRVMGEAPRSPSSLSLRLTERTLMAEAFRDHPTDVGTRVWRQSPWRAVGSGITLILCVGLTGGVLAAAGFGLATPNVLDDVGTVAGVGAGILLFVLVMGAIAQLLWRDMRGKSGASITLTDSEIILRLPPSRSLIHDPPRCNERVAWSDVICVEARHEAYGAQGMAMHNRVYRLRRRAGDPVFLFEQRGLRSNVATASMQELAEEIAARAGGKVREMGKFEGRGGLLGAWRAAPPGWTAAPVSAKRWATLQWRVTFTGLIGLLVVLLLALPFLIRAL